MITVQIIAVLSVVLFCVTCRQFIRAVLAPIPISPLSRPYARGAMLVDKTYKILSWGVLMSTFLLGLIYSFAQVFTQI